MGAYRTPTQASPFYLPTHKYLASLQYARQYDELKAELQDLYDQCKATGLDYSKDPVQTSGDADTTYIMAARIAEVNGKLKKISSTIIAVAPQGLDHYLFLSVCQGWTFKQLVNKTGADGKPDPVPMGKNAFARMRQRFYFELSKKI